MGRVVSVETWLCRRPYAPGTHASVATSFGAHTFGKEYVVLRLATDDGLSSTVTCLAANGTATVLAYLEDAITPVVIGRDVAARRHIWEDLRDLNRRLAFFPNFLPGPVDVALWDLASQQAGLPLYKFLGARRDRLPAYASSQFMPQIESYIAEATALAGRGYTAYKAHPGGGVADHIALARELRRQFPGLGLMLDPAGFDYTLGEAVRVGRALEQAGFEWFEEPFHDQFTGKYATLCKILDIPVAATEAAYGGPPGIARFLTGGSADIVRADVSWTWGVTGVLAVANVAESFGRQCEIHTTNMGTLDLANLHVACAISNSKYIELFQPADVWSFPQVTPLELDASGNAVAPGGPGTGMEVDWDYVDDSTYAHWAAGQ